MTGFGGKKNLTLSNNQQNSKQLYNNVAYKILIESYLCMKTISYFLHQLVLEVDEHVGFFAVRFDESVQRVAVRHPTDQTGVHRERHHRQLDDTVDVC